MHGLERRVDLLHRLQSLPPTCFTNSTLFSRPSSFSCCPPLTLFLTWFAPVGLVFSLFSPSLGPRFAASSLRSATLLVEAALAAVFCWVGATGRIHSCVLSCCSSIPPDSDTDTDRRSLRSVSAGTEWARLSSKYPPRSVSATYSTEALVGLVPGPGGNG